MNLPIQHLSIEDAETINASLCLAYTILYEDKIVESEDERVSKDRLMETIVKLMPSLEING